MIEIKHRHTGAVLYTAQNAQDVRAAVREAVAAKADLRGSDLRWSDLSGSDLSGSDLSGSDLSGSNLSGSDLRGSNLSGSNLRGSNLSGSDLRGSNLSGSNLRGSDLRGSDLRWSDLSGSDLSGSNLRGSDLRGSDLRGSDLRGSDLRWSDLSGSDLSGASSRVVLAVRGLPSGPVEFKPTPDGWRISIGCWREHTTDELRALIAKDTGWPEATGAHVTARRPMLAAVADLCDAWAADRADVLAEIVAKWATKTDAAAVSS